MGKVARIKEPSSGQALLTMRETANSFALAVFLKTFSKLWQTITVIASFANVGFRRFILTLVK